MSDEVEGLQKRAEARTPKYPELTFRAFLEDSPPDAYANISDVEPVVRGSPLHFATPDITLYCEAKECDGTRIFRSSDVLYVKEGWAPAFLQYTCRNCGTRSATFAIRYHIAHTSSEGWKATFLKIGQVPQFGARTPARLISLIGPDREVFLQGRRAENRGLGIGAFAYYRRVVENQKNRIISEIAKVAELLGSTKEADARFKAALAESRFSESIGMVRDLIPQSLMISGRNPLTLLHSALSKGLHDPEMTDTRCLQLAQSIRTVLAELAERSAEALKSTKEIEAAISTLLSVRQEDTPPQ